jgi:hypothetical protein
MNKVNSVCPSNNKRWTAKDDQILRQMVKDKANTAQVAIVLGRTKASIWGRKSFLGLEERLSSSKGKSVSAPTTLRSVERKNQDLKIQKPQVKRVERQLPNELKDLDLQDIARLAKKSGAKIVITFE